MTDSSEFDEVQLEDELTAESGQGLAEYALILAFIAIVCAAALGTLGTTLANSAAWTIP
ncbi:MAG: Flp family type IVb pilin [Dehalococcoidia bacterium]